MLREVKVYEFNKDTGSKVYKLKEAASDMLIYDVPNNWKTRKGAESWAKKHGYKIAENTAATFKSYIAGAVSALKKNSKHFTDHIK